MSLAIPETGLTPQELSLELDRGARFVIYQYCISLLIITFRRTSDVHFLKAGESPAMRGLPYTLLSFVLGWWGIPWGFIYTPQVIYRNLQGGADVTAALRASLQA